MRSRISRTSLWLLLGSLLIPLLASRSAHAQTNDKKTTVAILYFDYSGHDEDMQFLRKGLTQMLVADLAGMPGITMVERTRLEEVLGELELGRDKKIDRQSALRVGKLLAARYLVMGLYFEFRGELQITANVVDVETGANIAGVKPRGKVDDFFSLEARLADELRELLREHLVSGARSVDAAPAAPERPAPRKPRAAKKSRVADASGGRKRAADKGGAAPAAPAAPPAVKAVGAGSSADKKAMKPALDTATAARYGRALDAMDRGDKKAAKQDLEAVLQKSPSFALASVDLASLTQ